MIALLFPWLAAAPPACFGLVGDVTLARGVEAELHLRGTSAWRSLGSPERPLIGNLEGTVRPAGSGCDKPRALCLGFEATALDGLLAAPFLAVSVANNHAGDYGEAGRSATQLALTQRGIGAIGGEGWRAEFGGEPFTFFAIDGVGASVAERQRALEDLRLRILRASAESTVVVLPHFGVEGEDEPSPDQVAWSARFLAWGASLVAGAHTHRPQPHHVADDGLIFYGLGNFVFDQPGGAGWKVECCPDAGSLRCTRTPWAPRAGSSFPEPTPGGPVAEVTRPLPRRDLSFRAHPHAAELVTVEPLGPPGWWFALRRTQAHFDGERALRPYVFRVEGQGVKDVWRGSALSWPLVAARLVDGEGPGEKILCALHRDDSFLHPRPETLGRRWAAYRPKAFGFTRIDTPAVVARCAQL